MRPLTGLSTASEVKYLRSTQQRIERKYVRRYKKEIARAMGLAAKSAGNSPAQSMVWISHQRNIRKILEANWKEAARYFGNRIIEAAEQKAFSRLPMFNALMLQTINSVGARRVTEIAGTTQEQAIKTINDVITEATLDGLGEVATAKLMKSKINYLSQWRSRVISRTETSTAANTASSKAAKATGLPLKKKWVTNLGGRERDSHKRANGQTVGMNEKFSVGSDHLDHPSDPQGSAKEVINCRCVEVVGL